MARDCQFFDFRLSNDDPVDIVRAALSSPGTAIVGTLNAHSFNVSLKDAPFREALLASDALVADGIGVVWAARLKGASGLRKISGFDLFQASMRLANEEELTVGFLGSTPEVLEKIATRAKTDYPNTVVRTLSPPFASAFSDAEASDLLG